MRGSLQRRREEWAGQSGFNVGPCVRFASSMHERRIIRAVSCLSEPLIHERRVEQRLDQRYNLHHPRGLTSTSGGKVEGACLGQGLNGGIWHSPSHCQALNREQTERQHITPVLIKLHCLLLSSRIDFKNYFNAS